MLEEFKVKRKESGMVENDKLVIWARKFMVINPQVDTVTLLIINLEDIINDGSPVIDLLYEREVHGENKKLRLLLEELVDLDLNDESILRLIEKLRKTRSFNSRMNLCYAGHYTDEFEDLIERNF